MFATVTPNGIPGKVWVEESFLNKKMNQEYPIMITAIVQFPLSGPVTVENAKEIFSSTAPKYIGIKGLIRKYYLLSEDGKTGGGVYLWESREDAEAFHNDEWKKFIFEKYGIEPSVSYFHSPVVVESLKGEIC